MGTAYLDQKVVVKIVASGALFVLVAETAALDKIDTLWRQNNKS